LSAQKVYEIRRLFIGPFDPKEIRHATPPQPAAFLASRLPGRTQSYRRIRDANTAIVVGVMRPHQRIVECLTKTRDPDLSGGFANYNIPPLKGVVHQEESANVGQRHATANDVRAGQRTRALTH
jgi:hypothetical protein